MAFDAEFRMVNEVAIMMSNDFEKAFGDFLDRREYDQAENALFAMVRISFLAGWKAAEEILPSRKKYSSLCTKRILIRTRLKPI